MQHPKPLNSNQRREFVKTAGLASGAILAAPLMSNANFFSGANDVIKAKAESGELGKIHQKCAEAEKNVEDGVSKVMDQIDRTMH